MGQALSTEEVSDGYILTVATREGRTDVVQMYLDKNPVLAFHLNSDGSTVVQAACNGGQHEILNILLTSLRLSAVSNIFNPVTRLLDQTNSTGRTALSLAAAGMSPGHSACAHAVLDAGASVWIPDQAGKACLHHAARTGNSAAVEMVLDAAGQQPQEPQQSASEREVSNESSQGRVHRYVNLPDAAGRTALHYAMHSSDLETIHTLITAGSNLTAAATADSLDREAPTNQGATPLHIAALRGDVPAAVLLLTAYITAAAGALPELDKGPCVCSCRQRQSAGGEEGAPEVQHCHQECCSRASCDGDMGDELPDPRNIADAYGMTPHAAAMAGIEEDLKQLLDPQIPITELLEKLPRNPSDAPGSRVQMTTAAYATTGQRPVSYRRLRRALSHAGSYLTRQKHLQEESKGAQKQQQHHQSQPMQ